MQKEVIPLSDRYLTDVEASQLTGLSRAWFRRARWTGQGPTFIKLGNAVRYRESSLRAWFDARERSSTSDGGNSNA